VKTTMPMNEPTIVKHAKALYAALEEQATDEHINGMPAKVFQGSVLQVYEGLGISRTYYSRLFKGLEQSGCITKLHRGGGNTGSTIVLHHPPPPDRADAFDRHLTQRVNLAILSQRLDDVETLIGGINIGEVLVALSDRIEALEAKTGGNINGT
jgi:hypothetical protein